MTKVHPPPGTLERFVRGSLSGDELLETDDHLAQCHVCRAAVEEMLPPNALAYGWLTRVDDDHCTFEEMSEFVDGLADDASRFAIQAHLDLCAMCRAEVADLAEVAAAAPAPLSMLMARAERRDRFAEEEHVSYETLLRRSERKLSKAEEDRVNAHLAACAACGAQAKEHLAVTTGIASRKRSIRKRVWLSTAAALAAAAAIVVGVAVDRTAPKGANPALAPVAMLTSSMAVLPLRNLTAVTGDDFLSVGIADAVNTRLESASGLYMRPMNSIVAVQRESSDLQTAVSRLNADVVLDGQFGLHKDVIRVTWKVIDTHSGNALLSESIEGHRRDLLGLIDEVTTRTATRLNKLPGAPADRAGASDPRSTNPAAFEAYLKARSLAPGLDRASYEAQVLELKRAIRLDPAFAAAHADLAIALQLSGLARSLDTRAGVLDEAERHAREAVRLDPNLASAHVALGRALAPRRDGLPEAMREIVAAIELKPTDLQALQIMTTYFASAGDLKRAECVSDSIARVDPLSSEAKLRGYWWIEAANATEALRQAEAAMADPRTQLAGHDIRGQAFILLGDLDAADREASAALELAPDHFLGQSLKAMVAAGRGQRAEAEKWLGRFAAVAKTNHFGAVRVALCHAKLGNVTAALDWIDRAASLGHHRWYSLTRHPWFARLQSEPRFVKSVSAIKRDLDIVQEDVLRVYPSICVSGRALRPAGTRSARAFR